MMQIVILIGQRYIFKVLVFKENDMANLLSSEENPYRGCWVSTELPSTVSQFAEDLSYSLSVWQKQGIKVVWLTILPQYAQLLSVATERGFTFHHVPNTGANAVVLTKRLVDGALIPEFANHTIGVGGIVLNDVGQVLTVIEKHDMQTRPGHFKFPGGAMDKSELLAQAAIREVHEETGIKTTFNGIVGFRHYHRGQFGTSNIYFLCHLSALTHDIVPCPTEIGLAQWMTTDEYLASETIMPFNKTMLQAALDGQYFHLTDLGEIMGIPPRDYEILTPRCNLV